MASSTESASATNGIALVNRSMENKAVNLSFMFLDSATLHDNIENQKHVSDNPNAFLEDVEMLYLQNNRLEFLPQNVTYFSSLRVLDISNNGLSELSQCVLELKNLDTLIARCNNFTDTSLPKNFSSLTSLEILNLSNNHFKCIPHEIFELSSLKTLYMGGNQIEEISGDIRFLERLEVLYLGGNALKTLPEEMGHLHNLQALVLCGNRLESLPTSISHLHRLRSLALHKNMLTTLPPGIVRLRALIELSLRENPLVKHFVNAMTYNPPNLMELSARAIKISKVPYETSDLPAHLIAYLGSAHRCVNANCKGVYFDSKVEHIKFVDFCGKYRVPLLQYLCSPKCGSNQPQFRSRESSDSECTEAEEIPESRLKRVLLG